MYFEYIFRTNSFEYWSIYLLAPGPPLSISYFLLKHRFLHKSALYILSVCELTDIGCPPHKHSRRFIIRLLGRQ